jgi:hypothetical protein
MSNEDTENSGHGLALDKTMRKWMIFTSHVLRQYFELNGTELGARESPGRNAINKNLIYSAYTWVNLSFKPRKPFLREWEVGRGRHTCSNTPRKRLMLDLGG